MANFDQFLQQYGDFGRYQKLMVALLVLPACFLSSWNNYILVFLTYTPDHLCKIPMMPNDTITRKTVHYKASPCYIETYSDLNLTKLVNRTKCSDWTYSTKYFDETLISRWNMVCDRSIEPKNAISVISGTVVLNLLVYSYAQDKWGRKLALMINVGAYLIFGTISLFMPSLESFTVLRSLTGSGLIGFNIAYIWALEFTGPSKRTLVTTIMCAMFAVARSSMSLVAWVCSTWLQMSIATCIPFVFLFSFWWLVPESPRWLLSAGKMKEFNSILHSIRKSTKRTSTDDDPNGTIGMAFIEPDKREANQSHATMLDLVRAPQLRKKTILVTVCWIANAVVYTSMAYNTENIGGNFFVTWVIISMVEAPAAITNVFILERFGRVRPLCLFMTLSGVFCLLTAPSQYLSDKLVVTLAVIGQFCICVTYAIIYQLAGELYPTVVRAQGVGLGTIAGNIGNAAMPYIIHSAQAYKMLPMIILGILGITGGMAGLFLPEPMGCYLPQTLDESEQHLIVGTKSFKRNIQFWKKLQKSETDMPMHIVVPCDTSNK